MSALPLAAIVTSPLERCRQTASALGKALATPADIGVDRRLIECGYGDWTGRR